MANERNSFTVNPLSESHLAIYYSRHPELLVVWKLERSQLWIIDGLIRLSGCADSYLADFKIVSLLFFSASP